MVDYEWNGYFVYDFVHLCFLDMQEKRWIVAEPISEEIKQQFPEIHPVVLQLLWNRGIRTQEEIDVYIGPDWSRDTYSHALFLNMEKAVSRTFQALERGENITVHGDYDADGVCGSTVLISTLREICRQLGFDEHKIDSYIPHREKEGYGMSVETIEHLKNHKQTTLVITVDCGISNKPAVDRGKELGVDTIICDHHTMPAELPDQAILIHPLVPGETYPNKKLCGTGVAFKLACGLIEEARKRGADMPEGYEKWLLDLVAIATVTDVVPLQGENRTLEHFGLTVLNKTRRIGLQRLIEVAGGTLGKLDITSIGFLIGPRINAAGRMSHAQDALNLLLSEDEMEASMFAIQLQEINIERQKASQAMYLQAKKQVDEGAKLIVVVGEGWSAGLVGLVAGKLVTDYHRPVYAVGKIDDHYVGSGRSIGGFDVTAALRHAGEHLDKFGGHPEACGFSVTGSDRFESAVAMLHEFANASIQDDASLPTLKSDVDIQLEEITWELFAQLDQCRPFGQGNPSPIFTSRNVRVQSMKSVGNGAQHLKLTLRSRTGKMMPGIGFNLGGFLETLSLGKEVDIAYEIDVNEWNGSRELQVRLVDIKL